MNNDLGWVTWQMWVVVGAVFIVPLLIALDFFATQRQVTCQNKLHWIQPRPRGCRACRQDMMRRLL